MKLYLVYLLLSFWTEQLYQTMFLITGIALSSHSPKIAGTFSPRGRYIMQWQKTRARWSFTRWEEDKVHHSFTKTELPTLLPYLNFRFCMIDLWYFHLFTTGERYRRGDESTSRATGTVTEVNYILKYHLHLHCPFCISCTYPGLSPWFVQVASVPYEPTSVDLLDSKLNHSPLFMAVFLDFKGLCIIRLHGLMMVKFWRLV